MNRQGRPQIALLYVYQNQSGSGSIWASSIVKRILKNRQVYCERHGYTLLNGNRFINRSRPTAWSKLLAAEKYLALSSRFDYLFYVDMDIVIMDINRPVEYFIGAAGAPEKDLTLTADWNGINSGVWIAKNTPFAKWFLQLAWNQTQLIPRTNFRGQVHPFEYEQRSFHYLLNTEEWQKRGLPPFVPTDNGMNITIDEMRSHFNILPQCAFNSYSMHFLDFRGDRESAQYVDGDFLIHFAGIKGQKKYALMDHYLREIERRYKR
jgi:hypothetical protein